MCYNVKKISKRGKYKEDNYNGFKGQEYDITAWTKCGYCPECLAEKANNWVVRNHYESRAHKEKCFITLTYAENPKILIKKDLQDFLKRLRKELDKDGVKLRYYGCGEYGTLRGRPHFHVILYGWSDKNAKYLCINKKGNICLQSDLIQAKWGKGRTTYQEFNEHEIPYISLYSSINDTAKHKHLIAREEIAKKISENRNRYHEFIEKFEKIKGNFLEVKEFNCWSIGLGFDEWIKDYENVSKTFTEYIEDKEFITPTPWVKKMANMGEIRAIEEMKKRAHQQAMEYITKDKRQAEKNIKAMEQNIKDILNFSKEISQIEEEL